MADVDWQAVRLDYVRGGGSYEALAKKYGISVNTLSKRAKRESWFQARRDYVLALHAETDKKSAISDAKRLAALQMAGNRMCEQLEAIMRDAERELHTHVSTEGEVVKGEAVNDKKLYNLSRSIETMTRAMRNLFDIQTGAEREHLAMARQELALKTREQDRREREDGKQGPQQITVTYRGPADMEAYHD